MRVLLAPLTLMALLGACSSGPKSGELADGVECISLLGVPLARPLFSEAQRDELQARIDQALANYEASPGSEDSIIWLGRRLAYLGNYGEAIDIYSLGLERHPDSFKLLRHRGHRNLTLRRLDAAVADFTRAARLVRDAPVEIEPDGMPNPTNQPRSNSHFNIFYHLGLAHYALGDLPRAEAAYRQCLDYCRNDDSLCAAMNWLNLIVRLDGRHAEAAALRLPIQEDMDILENSAYHKILLLHQGKLSLDDLREGADTAVENASLAYGIAGWLLCEGRLDEAHELMQRITLLPRWEAFGFLAAEADLARR